MGCLGVHICTPPTFHHFPRNATAYNAARTTSYFPHWYSVVADIYVRACRPQGNVSGIRSTLG